VQNPEFEKVLVEKQEMVIETMTKFLESLDEATETEEIDNYLTMDDLESMWSDLESKTKEIYSDFVRTALSKANEKRLIESKKENSQRKG
jgi:hypothetical protein